MSGLYRDVATGETIKRLRVKIEDCGWLNKIQAYDGSVASNGTINFADLGAAPNVLLNNTNYPLSITGRTDTAVAITLDHFQTTVTSISQAELEALTYDKQSSVLQDHTDSIFEEKVARSLWRLAPQSNAAATPVSNAAGAKLTAADLIALKEKFDKLKVPKAGRILVLCPKHVSDLLAEDVNFAQRYNNTTTGAITNQYGFEIYESPMTPYYTSAGAKVAWGTSSTSTDKVASIAFYAGNCMRAQGKTEVFIDEPTSDYQEWRYAVSDYFIAMPKKAQALAAILSAQ